MECFSRQGGEYKKQDITGMSFILDFVLLDKSDNFPPVRLIMRTFASCSQIKVHFRRWNQRNEIIGELLGALDLTSNSSPVKLLCTVFTDVTSAYITRDLSYCCNLANSCSCTSLRRHCFCLKCNICRNE